MNKGLTLVELLAVIVILGILALITVSITSNILTSSKDSLYESQKESIIETAEKWVSVNSTALYSIRTGEESQYNLTISKLVEDGYLDNEKISDPRDSSKCLIGDVIITYDGTKYDYEYEPISGGCD